MNKFLLPVAIAVIITFFGEARKIKVPPIASQPVPTTTQIETFIVDKTHPNDSIPLSSVAFSRFNKPVDSTQESFLCKNTATSTLIEVTVKIDYYLNDGTKFHSRTIKIPCEIPAGETRQLSVSSFDRQKSYRYVGSRVPPRRESTPFDIRIWPVALTFIR